MLNNATCFKRVFIATGYSDLRRGLEGLANIIRFQFHLDPYDKDTLYLFCGKRNDRIKGLLWEGDGFLLAYKRLESGKFDWPRNEAEVREMTPQQFRWLMEGLSIDQKKSVKKLNPERVL